MFQFAVDPQDPFARMASPITFSTPISMPVVESTVYKSGPLESYLLSGVCIAIAGYTIWRIYKQTRELIPIVNTYVERGYDNKGLYFKRFIDAMSESSC